MQTLQISAYGDQIRGDGHPLFGRGGEVGYVPRLET